MDKKKRTVEKISTQEKENLLKNFLPFLSQGRFINVASCSLERMPSVAPKLIAKTHKNIIYLIDYIYGRTYSNLKTNPRVSVSFFDDRTFTGYQLNGSVEILEDGEEFERLSEEFQAIKTNLTVEHILFNIRSGEKAKPLEFSLPKKFAILKLKIVEIIEISSSGSLKSKLAVD
jgi:hypothetical protein